jgi:glyoxylase-like metal-dependent hydrolase (beta-lactamase superfamily II)
MATLPNLWIPQSTATVNVSIINSSGTIRGIPFSSFYEPPIVGHEWLAAPCTSFFIEHDNRSLVFDLGIRKDWQNLPEAYLDSLRDSNITVSVPTDVREILDEGGVDSSAIEAVIWSHAHVDHVGDPSTFDNNTALIVGPGVQDAFFPGYPTNPNAAFLESDVAGREIKELKFNPRCGGLKIGHFEAIDFFGDGSFYLLNSPGHAIGHISALARVTSNPDSFILMGGDTVHQAGVLRPHKWHPLPEAVSPNPFTGRPAPACPGDLFEGLLRNGRDSPFYVPSSTSQMNYNTTEMIESIHKLQETDAHDNIFVVPAHDEYILRVVDLFPARANDFMDKGWVHQTRWAFLRDFARAVNYTGELYPKQSWDPAGNQTIS